MRAEVMEIREIERETTTTVEISSPALTSKSFYLFFLIHSIIPRSLQVSESLVTKFTQKSKRIFSPFYLPRVLDFFQNKNFLKLLYKKVVNNYNIKRI